MKSTKLFKEFFASERSGAFVLMLATALSLLMANTLAGEPLQHFFHSPLLGMPIEKWVNRRVDGHLLLDDRIGTRTRDLRR